MVNVPFSKQSPGDKVFIALTYVLVTIIVCVVIYPLLFVVSASFSDPDLVLSGKVVLFPKGFTLKPYTMVFENEEIWRGYLNTVIYTVLGTFINVVFTVLLAYPLSRQDMPLRRPITLLIVFTMYFEGGMIPNYLLVRQLGMYNTIWAMVIPTAISTYNFIVAKSFFETSIPKELYESAEIDGSSDIRTLMQIVIPLSPAILAVLALYYAVDTWNAYFNALIYLQNEKLFPLQIILRNILLLGQTEQMGSNDVGMGEKIKMAEAIKYSAIVISSLPILCVYPFVQKYFVKGVMIGAVKG
ncbi:MAG: carbohydrate ABC transporter permease [Sphaerochaeta sp.]|jgi:putative aldouronate transport system permease protein|nr:carbohydrate ABC transporter permease [Sphaerochaeta sp.]MCI2128497.1 carbohydrate ABC transporter permease [Sphaerochaeta sp.]